MLYYKNRNYLLEILFLKFVLLNEEFKKFIEAFKV